MLLYTILDALGIIAFAISGTLTAIEKKLDLFGIFIIALVTSIGGGTLRDLMIGNTPVAWLQNLPLLYLILGTTIITIIFRKQLNIFRTSLLLFDTIGIGIFTLVGIEKGIAVNLSPLVCVILGTVTACFGGVIRDILCNEIPVLFRKEIYATACFIGGLFFFLLQKIHFVEEIAYVLSITFIVIIRLLSVYFKWSLPQIRL